MTRFEVLVSRRGDYISTPRNEALRGIPAVVSGDYIDHVEACEGGGSVKADQVPQDKLWSTIESTSSCFGQAGEDIVLHFLVGDDVHPYRKRRGWRAAVVKVNGDSGL